MLKSTSTDSISKLQETSQRKENLKLDFQMTATGGILFIYILPQRCERSIYEDVKINVLKNRSYDQTK